MTIVVQNEWVKKYHAKKGYNNLFGRDVDERQKMTDEQLTAIILITGSIRNKLISNI